MNCYFCGIELVVIPVEELRKKREPGNLRTRDHLIPKSRKGRCLPFNTVDACLACNNEKGSLTAEEYRVVLAYRAKVRTHISFKFAGEIEK